MKLGRLFINIVLALIWCMLHSSFDPVTFVIGFILGWGSLKLFSAIVHYSDVKINFWEAFKLFFVFLYEMIKANFQIAFIILTPRMNIRPGIVEYTVDLKNDGAIVLLANMISLTPGTLTVDISSDKKHLYVHAMVMETPEKLKDNIKRIFERRILKMIGEQKKTDAQ